MSVKGYLPDLSMTTSDQEYIRRKHVDYHVVISAECESFKTHEPHVIRKGFLGIGRRECEGYIHRHYMQLDSDRRPFLFTVQWKCHCGEAWSVNKDGFYKELLHEPATVIYSNGWITLTSEVNGG